MYLVRFKQDVGVLAKKGDLLELTNSRTESLRRHNKIYVITYIGDYLDLIKLRRID